MPIEIKYIENNSGVILDSSGYVGSDELVNIVNEVFNN